MSNVFQIHATQPAASRKTSSVYVRVNEKNIVEYGLQDVNEDDVPRFIKALFLLGALLMEIRHD